MIIQGMVLKVERRSGTSERGNYDYFVAHVLDGLKVYECRLADNFGDLPHEGEMIRAEVSVSVFTRRSGAPDLAVRLEGRAVDEGVPARGFDDVASVS